MNSINSFHHYYMNICEVVKLKSKDTTKVGVVLVSIKNNKIISTGYNGPCSSFDDSNIDWKDREFVHSIVIHAEANSLLYADSKFEDAILYTTLSPCLNCLKLISATHIKKIIFKNKYKDFNKVVELSKLFKIELIDYNNIDKST